MYNINHSNFQAINLLFFTTYTLVATHNMLYSLPATYAKVISSVYLLLCRVLRVPRIAIHKNLFASLILNCISMIIFKIVVLLPYLGKNEKGLIGSAEEEDHKTILEQVLICPTSCTSDTLCLAQYIL